MNASEQQPKIKITNLHCFYDQKLAVEDVNLDLYGKEITAFIGPSGCGKSTVLRCINRMNDTIVGSKMQGQIQVSFADCDQLTDVLNPKIDVISLRRKIGMVFQRPNPFPMSIYDNIAYGPRLLGLKDKSELDKIVEQSLKYAVLWNEVKDKLYSASGQELSGGQQQRLCIARSLAVEPEILLLDEPCSALDPVATVQIEDLLVTLKDKLTIIIVTHNMQEASRISDRTAVFWVKEENRVGQMIEYKTTKELFSKPTDPRTEGYITSRFS